MGITNIDKNFDTTFFAPNDIEWLSVADFPSMVYGVEYCKEEKIYRRLPKNVADSVSAGVSLLSKHTAGGRIRFVTDSPYVAVRLEEPFDLPMSHMTIVGTYGVSMFVEGMFSGIIMPSYEQIRNADPAVNGTGTIIFDGIRYPYKTEGLYQTEIYLPLYSAVNEIFIGVKKGSTFEPAVAYKHKKPVLFYGSSITQGGCASKPGDDYIGRISRMLDTDFVNFGFSGNAKAEKVIAEYIAKQDPSVFVLDYDHNAPDADYLKKTHFALYKTIRAAHPATPIVMMTMPTIEGYELRDFNKQRRTEIIKSYEKAKNNDDKNVYFVDCYGCFGKLKNGECGTVDDCHPDSLGFLRMAERVYPILNKLLNEEKQTCNMPV